MRRLLAFTAAVVGALAVAGGSAAQAPPCNDTDGDGSASGREYAHYHIAALAHEGMLGAGGHRPGSHRGFSACNPSGS